MSLLYCSSFKYPDGELRKNQDFMDTYHHHQHQNHQHNSGLLRYRSAPSSFLENLVNGSNTSSVGAGANSNLNCEDYQYIQSSTLEMENLFAKYMAPYNGSGDSAARDLQEFGGKAMKQEEAESISQPNEYASGTHMIYQSFPMQNLVNDNTTVDGSFGVINSMGSNSSMQPKIGTANGSNLVRQNSSPAGFVSNLGTENGFTLMRDFGSYRACNTTTSGEATPSTTRLNGHMSLTSGSRLVMPQIAEIENEGMGGSSPENRSLNNVNGSNRHYMSNFANESWNAAASFGATKRTRENDGNMFSNSITLETQNGDARNQSTGLTQHLSLLKTSSEMAVIEKFLHFQGSVPCKIRAKRGCATHPRSIAERVRRTRISERMRKLQELFPNLDKQINTADMLDMAVEHIKDLQKQVKKLTDTKAQCMCKDKRFSNLSA